MAGAVFLPLGSSNNAVGIELSACSAAINRCCSLHTKIALSNNSLETRANVLCSNDMFSFSSGKNCLGIAWRESGHKREPMPPAKITGVIKVFIMYISRQQKYQRLF